MSFSFKSSNHNLTKKLNLKTCVVFITLFVIIYPPDESTGLPEKEKYNAEINSHCIQRGNKKKTQLELTTLANLFFMWIIIMEFQPTVFTDLFWKKQYTKESTIRISSHCI